MAVISPYASTGGVCTILLPPPNNMVFCTMAESKSNLNPCDQVRARSTNDMVDKQDALCLLSLFDTADARPRDGIITKAEAKQASESTGMTPGQSAALKRLENKMDEVGHVTGSKSTLVNIPIIIKGFPYPSYHNVTINTYGVSKDDLTKCVK